MIQSWNFPEPDKKFEKKIISEYSKMEKEYNFETIDGTLGIEAVQTKMRKAIKEFMDSGVIR